MDKKVSIVASAGHNNGEFTAWLLNHSPDCPPPATSQWTIYDGYLGTHYRAEDSSLLDNVHLTLTESYRTFDRNKPPDFCVDTDKIKKFVKLWKELETPVQTVCIYVNCFNPNDICELDEVDKVVGSYWDFPNLKERHFFAEMEFDPTSTPDSPKNNNEPIEQIMTKSVMRHVSETRKNKQTDYDFVFWQSKVHDMDYVMSAFDACGLTRPDRNFIKEQIDFYYDMNKPEHEITHKLNAATFEEFVLSFRQAKKHQVFPELEKYEPQFIQRKK